MCAPVTKPTLAPAGRPSSSSSQPPTMSSITATAGDMHVERAVLIPRARQPVGRHGHRHGAAGHEAEIARAGGRDEAGSSIAHEIGDDEMRIGRRVGQWTAQPLDQALSIDRAADMPVSDVIEIRRRIRLRLYEKFASGHGEMVPLA